MPVRTFRGGVHPADRKSLSADKKIVRLDAPDELTYLTNQHIGKPAVPVVEPGDRVLMGQLIARGDGFVSANIHSAVSGTVKAIGPRMCQTGDIAVAVVVENDGAYEPVEGYGEKRDYLRMSNEEIRTAIREAGIVGMGGAGFPAAVKLSVKDDSTIGYVLCNGAECEPYITCDYRLMLERAERAVLGMKIVLRMFENARGVFGIETNKMDGIQAVQTAIRDSQRITVVPLKQKYPQGGERMLIAALSGRKINSKQLPADAGCLVFNFHTLCAIADAVCDNIPLIRRVVTVTGEAIAEPSNFEAPIGMQVSQLIEKAGGYKVEPEKLIAGGPMMGAAIYSTEIPVIKTSSCFLALAHDETKQYSPIECIRCGMCLTTCPERLMPIKLKNTADVGDYAEFERLHGLECIGCGCCTFICPSKRRLSQSITIAKRFVLAEKKKAGAK